MKLHVLFAVLEAAAAATVPMTTLDQSLDRVVANVQKKPSSMTTLSLLADHSASTGRVSLLAERKAAIRKELVQLGALPVPAEASRQQQVTAIKEAREAEDDAEAAKVRLAHAEGKDATESMIKHALEVSETGVMEMGSSGPTYDASNKGNFSDARDEQIERLKKQEAACTACELAELKLQGAYNVSLAYHKTVEAVTADLLNQTTAQNAFEAAETAHDNKLGAFKVAKTEFMAPATPFTCGQAGTLPMYSPESPTNLTLPTVFTDPSELVKLNGKAQEARDAKIHMDIMKAAWDATIAHSKKTGLCPAACTSEDVSSAEADSGAKDALVVTATSAKDVACAAISATLSMKI